MKRLLHLILILAAFTFSLPAKDKAPDFSYNVEGINKAQSNGGYIVSVTLITKNKNKLATTDFLRAAVHGALFSGISKPESLNLTGAFSSPAIMGSPMAETKYSEFFTPFFNNKTYEAYSRLMEGDSKVMKVGKEYHVTKTVVINDTQLKKDLKDAGLIKTLGSFN